ncbi:hypothetical protein GPECTOR_153g58 [Gonium pectorale]|uniref:Uncharacterized protein n=1 Tax=Gonium pectorale TaxID=33097 RepID=A0A150FYV0_GONPE|nr:hypothetical protein GPECTOR_153g58 [Gonium pectorale]|eukprot:KXZ42385.1 hypothetical protein GPECTOR_153g58 [Gonium pectorale]
MANTPGRPWPVLCMDMWLCSRLTHYTGARTPQPPTPRPPDLASGITYLNGALHRHFGGANFRRTRTERQPQLCEVDRPVCLCGVPMHWLMVDVHVRSGTACLPSGTSGNDCGVFATLFMRCIAAVNDCPHAFPFDADDMVAGRGLLLREVITSSILWMPQPRIRLLDAAP